MSICVHVFLWMHVYSSQAEWEASALILGMSALHKDAQRVSLNSNKVSGETRYYLHSPRTALHQRMREPSREPASQKQRTIHTYACQHKHTRTDKHVKFTSYEWDVHNYMLEAYLLIYSGFTAMYNFDVSQFLAECLNMINLSVVYKEYCYLC